MGLVVAFIALVDPARHIDGFVRLLSKAMPQPSEKAAHYLDTIAAAAKRVGELIDDLLTLSRTARQPLNLQRVDLQALVYELIHEAGPETAQRNVEWAVNALPAVMADVSLPRIVHRHGQRIWGEGALGEGAAFTFTMAQAGTEVVHEAGTDTAGRG